MGPHPNPLIISLRRALVVLRELRTTWQSHRCCGGDTPLRGGDAGGGGEEEEEEEEEEKRLMRK